MEKQPETSADAVDHPTYYGGNIRYEAIKVIEAWELGFCLGNTVKYIARAGKKSPQTELQDLKKAAWYLDREIANREQDLQIAAKVADHQASIEQDLRLRNLLQVSESASGRPVLAEVGKKR